MTFWAKLKSAEIVSSFDPYTKADSSRILAGLVLSVPLVLLQ